MRGERSGQVAVDGDGRTVADRDQGAVGGDGRQLQAAPVCGELAGGLGDGELALDGPSAQFRAVDDDRPGAAGERPADRAGEAVRGIRAEVSGDREDAEVLLDGVAPLNGHGRRQLPFMRRPVRVHRGKVIQMLLPPPSASPRTTAVPDRPRVSSTTVASPPPPALTAAP